MDQISHEDTAEVTPAQALSLYEAGEVSLLDVREPAEWLKGHAAGAVHMPLGELNPAAVDSSKPVIAVCRSGGRSAAATEQLRQAGFNVRNMTGGMSRWQDEGLPIITDAGEPGSV